MEAHLSQQIRVGIFVSLGLVAAMASIITLGANRSLFGSNVRIYAKLPQVQGLNKGSIVSLSGMTIGNVEAIDFQGGEGLLTVKIKIKKQFLERIPADSTVELRTQGALGDKYIFINAGNAAGPKLAAEGSLEPSKSTDLLAVISERGGEAEALFDIIAEIKKLMVAINEGNRVHKIVGNLNETSANLKQVSDEVKVLVSEIRTDNPQKLKRILTGLDSIITKIDKGEGTLGALINDSSLHDQLKSLVGSNPRKKYMNSVIRSTLEKSDGQ